MKKQSAVEWLVEKIKLAKPDFKFDSLIREAKAMEKQQMKDFVTTFLSSASPAVNNFIRDEFEKYYNETYGK
jgi:hypothetical protein